VLNRILGFAVLLAGLELGCLVPPADAQNDARQKTAAPMTDEQLYRAACAACHGVNGAGAPRTQVGFDLPLPDFTDCSFATREPDADWQAIVHNGGPARAFNRMMPAFGAALTTDEVRRTVDYIRTFCSDRNWPRGDLNLPRALVTEKAFPEDEIVFTTEIALEGRASIMNEFVYEKRLGARSQYEVSVPFGIVERSAGAWTGGMGDIALGFKRTLIHTMPGGSIFSAAFEAILPTGDEDDDLGKGTVVLEPFLAFGQILPGDAFVQLQAGVEFPLDRDRAREEGFWRATLGKSITEGRWGRTWSPMVELLGAREFVSGEHALWDVVPQVQVTLSTRQHIMANIGVRIPMHQTDTRQAQLWVYLLWDWFDGGLFEGW
jgi:mono/diheme cytochrome c family protein